MTAVVVYALAMFAHAAEWAAARRSDGAQTATSRPWSRSAPARPAELWSKPAAVAARRRGSGRQRVEQFGRIGVALTVIGFLLSVGGVVLRGLAAGRPPWGNMFEFTITAMVVGGRRRTW